MGVRTGIITVFAVLGLHGLLPGGAWAHPMLDRAVAAYEEADFEAALETFDAAERNAGLSLEELLHLFEMRALVHHALGDEAALRADLRRLVAVRGSYELSRLAPPSVRAVFDEVREAHGGENGVELRIEEKTIEGQPSMVATVLRVPDGLVDHTTLQCSLRSDGGTVSQTSEGTTVSVKLPNLGMHNGCTATARARQGEVLFSAGIEGVPAFASSGSTNRFELKRRTTQDDRQKSKKKKWPWIVAATAVVVAGGVTAGVVLSQRSNGGSQTQSGAVVVNW